ARNNCQATWEVEWNWQKMQPKRWEREKETRNKKQEKRKRWQCKDKTLGNSQPRHYSLMRACLLSPCLSSNEVINAKRLCLCVCLYLIVQNISKLNVYRIHFFFHIATT
ncbi:hypothetical protein PanWU01x14_027270, partial [Parasponia andersonii]